MKTTINPIKNNMAENSKPGFHSRSKYFKKVLTNGCVKNIGPFERIHLAILGRIDGARGLPKLTDDGAWNSPFMNRETNGYEEFCTRLWGILQLENKSYYARLEELIRNIQHTQDLISEAKCSLSEAECSDFYTNVNRKKGEEALSDTQIKSRRAAERAKCLAPFKSKINSFEKQLASELDEFFNLYGKLKEDDNSVRLICHRVKEHTLQRLDVYWNAALIKHPEHTKMPVIPTVKPVFRAEQTYQKLHEKLMEQAETLHLQMAKHSDDKEAA